MCYFHSLCKLQFSEYVWVSLWIKKEKMMQIKVTFRYATPCSWVLGYQYWRGICTTLFGVKKSLYWFTIQSALTAFVLTLIQINTSITCHTSWGPWSKLMAPLFVARKNNVDRWKKVILQVPDRRSCQHQSQSPTITTDLWNIIEAMRGFCALRIP